MSGFNKIFKLGGIAEFIFGITEKRQNLSGYGLTLQMHLLNVDKTSSAAIRYLAFLYPRYKVNPDNNVKTKKSKLKITVTPSKQMIESVSNKSFVQSESKKLI
ncbi:MAG TPA: hypothetical protein VH917_02720 [Ignavibacteriaceae bacterium]|jgi:hypothetical protein